MTELNKRRPTQHGTGSAAARRRMPEMSLHDAGGRARAGRQEHRSRAEDASAGYRTRESDRYAQDRRYAEVRERRERMRRTEPSRSEDRRDCRNHPPARRRPAKKRRGCFVRVLQTVILIVALLLAGSYVVEKLVARVLPQTSDGYYPVKYEQFIRTYAEKNGLEPAYVAAVILTESSYNPQAVSNVGARGLMQLMPETADWIAGKLDEEISQELLFDPETNIRFGCYYLGFLMERYNGDMTCATAAYHAGHGTVDKWLKNAEYSADGETLAVIASDVTNTYVGRVLKRYERYTEIYADAP